MALDTFSPPINPSVNGTSNENEFRVLEAGFGDGYTQRTPDGLNTLKEKYTLIFEPLTESEYETLETFLNQKQGAEAFLYAIPPSSTQKKWTCKKYNKLFKSGNLVGLQMEIRREYDLD